MEIGIGRNTAVKDALIAAGVEVKCTDIHPEPGVAGAEVIRDDVHEPDVSLYRGAEVIYAVRPGVEMVPSMIRLAQRVNADLLVYHLGGEMYMEGGEIIECGVVLHRYHRRRDQKRVVCF